MTPTTAKLGRPVDDAARDPAEGGLDVVDDDARQLLDGTRLLRAATAPRSRAEPAYVVPVGVLADPGDVEAAGPRLAGVA